MSSETQTAVPAPADSAPPTTTQASLAARLGVEAFGTFALVLAIVGVALYDQFANVSFVLPVALAGGLVLVALVASVGHVSGGHFNPAVTLGLTIAGRARWVDLAPYWLAQLVGGVLAGGALFVLIPQNFAKFSSKTTHEFFASTANGFGTHSPLYKYFENAAAQNSATVADYESHFGATLHGPSLVQTILIEAVVTALFVGVVIAATDKRSKGSVLAPLSIGVTLFVSISVAAPLTNGSVNPARSTASAVFSPGGLGNIFTGHGVAGQLWVFWVGPLVGAFVAALFFLAFAAPAPVEADVVEPASVEAHAVEPASVEADAVEEEGSAPVVLDEATGDTADATEDTADAPADTTEPDAAAATAEADEADADADASGEGEGGGDEQGPAPR